MKRRAVALVIFAALTASGMARADERRRVWILPFEQLRADASTEYLKDALPALLAVAVSHSDDALIDRQHMNELLDELSLTLEGLVSADDRHRTGRLLGATVMITGSFAEWSGDLLVTLQATDLETGMVTASSSLRGRSDQPGQIVGGLHRALAVALGRRSPDPQPVELDRAPLSSLHFMKGLSHYHSARYSHALAEFMLAADDEELSDTARLWVADSYMADRQYGHAYIELVRLTHPGSRRLSEDAVDVRLRECERHLSADDKKGIRALALRPALTSRSGSERGR